MFWAQDKWFGEDKLTHGAFTFGGAVLVFPLIYPWYIGAALLVAVSIAVEVVEWVRLDSGKTIFADRPSFRDLAWDALGIGVGGLWVYFLRECSIGLLNVFCHGPNLIGHFVK